MRELLGAAGMVVWATVFYWLTALAAVLATMRILGPTNRRKGAAIVGLVAALGYLPFAGFVQTKEQEAFAKAAWEYFKSRCETESGEKIYKAHDSVKSVLITKPLPPATSQDLLEQFWYGDPYSNATPWNRRAETAALHLAAPDDSVGPDRIGRGFDFVESVLTESGKFVKYHYPPGARDGVVEPIDRPSSRFGVSWEDISTPESREHWVAASRLRVTDMSDGSVVAERIGFLIEAGFGSRAGHRLPWLTSRGPNTTCPPVHTHSDRWFLLKVLKPIEEKVDGK
jgi:hypothetical protein